MPEKDTSEDTKVDVNNPDPGILPNTLMDAEQTEHLQAIEKKAMKLSRVAHQIEDILIAEDMTWGEWGEVVELFSTRIGQFVANVKINFNKHV